MTAAVDLDETAAPAVAEPVVITEPGIYDLTDEAYHGDPVPGGSLSSSGAGKLLAPSCPAKYKWARDHREPYKKHFEFGAVAHSVVLTAGTSVVQVDAPDWRTKAARASAAAARAAGKTPILECDYHIVEDMAAAIRAHPIAARLLTPGHGLPEQSLFWTDPATGITRRARLDWLPSHVSPGGRMLIPEYKTAVSAANADFEKVATNFGYVRTAPWYCAAVKACGLADDAVMLFVVQEKTPPYLVNVIELTLIAIEYGEGLNRKAIDTYARCVETGRWPGYSDGIEMISLPPWVERAYMEEKS